MILQINTHFYELLINGFGAIHLNSTSISYDFIDGLLIDNTNTWVDESERPSYQFTIPTSDLIEYIETRELTTTTSDRFNPIDGHTTTTYTQDVDDVVVDNELIISYLKQGGKYITE